MWQTVVARIRSYVPLQTIVKNEIKIILGV